MTIPANLAASCNEAYSLRDGTMGEVARAAYENKVRLEDCAERHKRVVELTRV